MTEQEWLQATDSLAMMAYLKDKANDRKLRLFACACCRRIWHLLPHDANRDLVAAIEDHPDGSFDEPDLKAAILASSRIEESCKEDRGYWAIKNLGRTYYKLGALGSLSVAILAGLRGADSGGDKAAEHRVQANLLRDLFGNPFRPARIETTWLAWNDRTVVRLAQDIYDERAFDRLPVLADALEEAGCTSPNILAHCRSGGEHVKGCWVVDALLGKE